MHQMIKLGKRTLTVGVALLTIAWSVGLLGLPLTVGAATAGQLIKITCTGSNAEVCSAVYYLRADGKRDVFPNAKTYFSWYPDFNGIVSISQTEMQSYPLGVNVTYRPGVRLVKIQTDPKVYAVAAGGVLRWVETEAVAKALYGDMWAKMVDDVVDSFFVNYTIGAKIATATDYDKAGEMAKSPTIAADKGYSGGPVAASGTLSVALASDTPASGIVAENTARVPFTKVNLTAGPDGDVMVESLVVRRGGTAAQDGAFSGVVLIDDATGQQIDTEKSFNSDHEATFRPSSLKVMAGTTKAIMLAGNMAASLDSYSGEVPVLILQTVTAKSGTVVGTPVSGNSQTLNSSVTIGTMTVAAGADNPSSSTQNIGITDYIFTGFKFTAGSAEPMDISGITINQGGTAGDADVTNMDLVVDGTVVSTVAKATDKDIYFDLRSSPVKLDKGKSVQINVRGDIAGGSGRTVRWDIKRKIDVVAKGRTYGYFANPSYPNTTEPYFNTGATVTINRGTLKVTPTAGVQNANVAEDSKEVMLGSFDFDVKGEAVSISSIGIQTHIDELSAGTGATTSDITSVKLVDETGKVLGGPKDPTNVYGDGDEAFGTATITDTFIMPVGITKLKVLADLSADFTSGDTIDIRITPTANITAKGENTGETLVAADKTPSSVQTSATFTVKTAALAVSVKTDPVAQTVVVGTKNHTFANFVLDAADSGEDVKVTAVKAELFTATSLPNDYSNWQLWDGSTQLAHTGNPDPTGTSAGGATSTFTLVTPLIVAKGTAKTITVKGSISSSASTSGSIRVGLPTPHATGSQISSTGKNSGGTVTVTLSVGDGQTMTNASAGSVSITKAASSPDAGLLPSNTSGLTVGSFRMSATNENINVEKIYLSATTTRGWNDNTGMVHGPFNQVNTIYLYDGSTLLYSVSPTTTNSARTAGNATVLLDMTNSPIVVPKDGAKDITVKVDTAAVTRYVGSKGAPGQGFTFSVNAGGDVTAKGAQSGGSASSVTVTGASLNAMSVYLSTPTVTVNDQLGGSAIASGTLATASSKDIYRFSVKADSSGDIGLYGVSFLVTTSTATATNFFLNDGTKNVANVTAPHRIVTDGDINNAELFAMQFTSDGLTIANTNVIPVVVAAGGSKTFTLKADLTCNITGTTNNCGGSNGSGSVQVQFLGDSSFPSTYPDSAATLDNDADEAGFIWGDFSIVGPLQTSSTTASSAEQWTNGMRVSGASGQMPATSTAVTFSK